MIFLKLEGGEYSYGFSLGIQSHLRVVWSIPFQACDSVRFSCVYKEANDIYGPYRQSEVLAKADRIGGGADEVVVSRVQHFTVAMMKDGSGEIARALY
jgi:hypothetical protein